MKKTIKNWEDEKWEKGVEKNQSRDKKAGEQLLFQSMWFEFKKTWKNRQTVQTFIITITSLTQSVSFLSSIFHSKFWYPRPNI